jgi:hypothetical protein
LQIRNEAKQICIDTMGQKGGQNVGLSACHGIGGNQAWSLTVDGEIRSDELCLASNGAGKDGQKVRMEKCAAAGVNRRHVFAYDTKVKLIVLKLINLSERLDEANKAREVWSVHSRWRRICGLPDMRRPTGKRHLGDSKLQRTKA